MAHENVLCKDHIIKIKWSCNINLNQVLQDLMSYFNLMTQNNGKKWKM